MKKILILSSLFILVAGAVSAQQIGRRSQFVFNPYLINPAVAGTKQYSPLIASYRNQWTGFDGAPTTTTFSGHTALPNNIGVGGIFFNDNTGGAIKRTGVELTGAYKVDLTNEDQISFGLSGVLGQFKFNNDSLVYYDPNDLALQGNMESNFNFDASFGFLVYGEQYFFGLAVPQLMQSKIKVQTNAGEYENRNIRHYLLMGSYNYYVSEVLAIQPSLMAKFTGVTPVQFDVNFRAVYLESIWGGISYRHRDAVVLMTGVEWNSFVLGYAYDITTTDAKSFSPHTHEVSLGYHIQRVGRGFVNKSFRGKRIIPRKKIERSK
jgi:type IX secretion system PorP/SprF family membrane protein